MSGNASFTFDDVAVVSVAACEAPEVVTSDEIDEILAPLFERIPARPGMLESLAGVTQRRMWPPEMTFMEAAAMAGEEAIAAAGVDRERIGVLVDTSVCRARLEPSSAVTVHDRLGLPASCMNFDLSNACLGFLNAIHVTGLMIDAGQIDYAIVVDGEGARELYENTYPKLLGEDVSFEELASNFASLTLGSGSVAMVLGRHSENPGSHRVIRGVFRAETQHHDLCVGSLEGMRTDTGALLDAGTGLAKLAWDEAIHDEDADWANMDRYVLHQVSKVHTAAMIQNLGIDEAKVPMAFPMYGNIGPASIPITLAGVQEELEPGDRILCLGAGSGLNVAALELLW